MTDFGLRASIKFALSDDAEYEAKGVDDNHDDDDDEDEQYEVQQGNWLEMEEAAR